MLGDKDVHLKDSVKAVLTYNSSYYQEKLDQMYNSSV